MAEIKFCENNYGEGVEEVIEKLQNEGIEVEIEPCIGYCGDCAMGPIALVDDELVQGETPDELYEKIKELL